jgi:hypothetical protein
MGWECVRPGGERDDGARRFGHFDTRQPRPIGGRGPDCKSWAAADWSGRGPHAAVHRTSQGAANAKLVVFHATTGSSSAQIQPHAHPHRWIEPVSSLSVSHGAHLRAYLVLRDHREGGVLVEGGVPGKPRRRW